MGITLNTWLANLGEMSRDGVHESSLKSVVGDANINRDYYLIFPSLTSYCPLCLPFSEWAIKLYRVCSLSCFSTQAATVSM